MTKLNVDTGGETVGKKLWERHQKDEYTHVDNYKEAICINCFKKDAAAATVMDDAPALVLALREVDTPDPVFVILMGACSMYPPGAASVKNVTCA